MSDADSIVSKLLNLSEEGKAKLDALLDEGLNSGDPIILDAAEW